MKYLIILVCALAGCSSKSSNYSTIRDKQTLTVIDLTKEYPEKELYVQEIADVDYIPLETNDSTLVSLGYPDAVSKQYIIYHNQTGQILVFNRLGKSLYSFNHKGGSHKEYSSIQGVSLDEEKEEIYILNHGYNTKIYVYSLNGEFKRRLVLPERYMPAYLIDYSKDSLICYNSYFLDIPQENMNEEFIKLRDNPYFFVSKHTGEITPLDYNIPNRIGNRFNLISNDGKNVTCYEANIYPLVQNTPDILISEFADDTLYSLESGKLLPAMTKFPSIHEVTSPMLIAADFFTDRYIFIRAIEKISNKPMPKQISMVYDRQSEDFYHFKLLNKDYSNKEFIYIPLKMSGIALPHNTGINCINPEYLSKKYKAGKLHGELKQIASKLKEDDNPVIMLIKFKE